MIARCEVEGCNTKQKARGWCERHFYEWIATGSDPLPRPKKVKRIPKPKVKRICSIDDCGRKHVARGWCEKHYGQWRKTGDPIPRIRIRRFISCTIDDCNGEHVARGWCVRHYGRWRRTGDPMGKIGA